VNNSSLVILDITLRKGMPVPIPSSNNRSIPDSDAIQLPSNVTG
jgi:hypothetical protein